MKNINRDNKFFYNFIKKISINNQIDINTVWTDIVYKIIDIYYNSDKMSNYPPNIISVIKDNYLIDEIKNNFNSFFNPNYNEHFINDFLDIENDLLIESKNIEAIFGIITQKSIEKLKQLINDSLSNKNYTNYIKYTSFPQTSKFNNANFKFAINSKNIDNNIDDMNTFFSNLKNNSAKYGCFYKLYQPPTIIE